MQEPLRLYLEKVVPLRRMGIEGQAYVGGVGLLLLIFTLGRIIYLLRKRKGKRVVLPVLPRPLQTSIWAAALLLIPAMAYPFQFVPEWSDSIGALQQFRSTGRLAWVFYYVYMGYAAWMLYAIYTALKRKKRIVWAASLLLGGIVLWGWETQIHLRYEKSLIGQHLIANYPECNADYTSLLAEQGYKPIDFQAIACLPYFHSGTDKVFAGDAISSRTGLALAAQTGLPLCNGIAARSSISRGVLSMQLVSHPAIYRQIADSLPNSKPLLLAWVPGSYRPGEKYLISLAKPILQTPQISLGLLEPGRINQAHDSLLHFWRSNPYNSARPLIWNTWGDSPFRPGERALQHDKGWLTLLEWIPDDGSLSQPSELSFWIQLKPESRYQTGVWAEWIRSGVVVRKQEISLVETADVWQDWARIQVDLPPVEPGMQVRFRIKGMHLTLDNLMIRRANEDVWLPEQGGKGLIYNNYWL
ncbi:MAG: hypothetical protein EAZ89_14345 [Bacteroidetes bacterium]|nr:MAG: hypothetical protein EAZ89_14345 [Bacteroidota bacterium]